MEQTHFEQARLWLEGANHIAAQESQQKFPVATAMCIHAIIKANDALTFKLLEVTAKRHDEARKLFDEALRSQKIKSEHARYKQTIQDAISMKAKVEYRTAYCSQNDFFDIQKKAERFLSIVEQYL